MVDIFNNSMRSKYSYLVVKAIIYRIIIVTPIIKPCGRAFLITLLKKLPLIKLELGSRANKKEEIPIVTNSHV